MIRGDVLIPALAAALLALTALPSPSAAALGCFRDGGLSAATCTDAADCGPVGGTDCTSGFCLCSGAGAPFCACAPVEAAPAPAASHLMLVLMVGLLTAMAAFELRRRAKARP